MTDHLTVVGGGLGGLVAAIAAREAGFAVTLHEARDELGGRARTSPGPHRCNWGPHVVYADGALWAFLTARGLARPAARAPMVPRLYFRAGGTRSRRPPSGLVGALVRLRRRREAPPEATFRAWARTFVDDETIVEHVCSAMGVATFDHDPGRLSAAFVQALLRRVTVVPPTVRYLPGGFGTAVTRLADHARRLGVAIETSSPVAHLPSGPVVIALPLDRAAMLLDDPTLTWTGTRTALLDLGLRASRKDPFIVSDLDECGWVETFSLPDPSLAPAGERLVQAQIGLRPDESLDDGVRRIEALLDVGYEGWRERETWRRRARIEDESGALDLPGSTWRDRPAIDRGDDTFVVSDMSAAPGLLSEVSVNAATAAVRSLTSARRLRRTTTG